MITDNQEINSFRMQLIRHIEQIPSDILLQWYEDIKRGIIRDEVVASFSQREKQLNERSKR